MPRTNFFPEVRLKPGTLQILGFTHEEKPASGIKAALGAQVANFRPEAYLLVEGTAYKLGEEYAIHRGQLNPVSTEGNTTVYQGTLPRVGTEYRFLDEADPVRRFLLQIPRIASMKDDFDKRTERPEFYFTNSLWDGIDWKIMSVLEAETGKEAIPGLADATFVTPEEAAELKQARIAALDGKIDGVSREELGLFFEKHQIVRSLLMARTAEYRARALGSYPLGGDVKLFLGCGHAGEALRFLKNPDVVKKYLSGAHETIRDVYEQNEGMQQEITAAFHASVRGQRIRSEERTYAMKQVVDNAMERYMQLAAKEGTKVIRI